MGTIKDITDLTLKLLESKEARKIATELVKIQSLVAQLQSEQAALSKSNSQLQSENSELKRELAQKEAAYAKELAAATSDRNLRLEIRLEDNVFRPVKDEVVGYGAGPWCTSCFETSGKLVTLHHKAAGGIGNVTWYKWECPSCKSSVSAPRKA